MRVLHFGRFYSHYFGGVERHVGLLLSRLKDHIEVDNLVTNEGPRTELVAGDGYRVYKAAAFGLAAGVAISPTFPLLARKLWRENAYDIAHLHFPDPLAHFATYFLPRQTRIVISWHSDIVRQKRLLAGYQPFLDRLLERASAIVASTPIHFTSSSQLGAAKPQRLHVVPYGIDYAAATQSPRVAQAAAAIRNGYPGKKIVFTVGRHVYYKGFEYLIYAMSEIEGAVLLLGGIGPVMPKLRNLASKLQLDDRIDFLGRLSDEELTAYYHACDVYCMPSIERNEAFGFVQLEAMGCGKPVVGCELHNGTSYVNQHDITGLIVPPRDPKSLARALKQILDDDTMRLSMGEAAKARVMREFSLDAMTAGTLAVYEKVLARR